MEKLKLKVANETLGKEMNEKVTSENYEKLLDEKQHEVADELGLSEKIERVGWENMTTKEVGTIGGHVGGHIGGQMVKNLIAMAEAQMAPIDEDTVKEAKSKLDKPR